MSIDEPSLPPVAPVGTDVIAPGHTFATVTDKISSIVLARKTPPGWWIGFLISFGIANLGFISIAYLLAKANVNVATAKINTLGERVEDVFLLEGARLHDEAALLKLETALYEQLRLT